MVKEKQGGERLGRDGKRRRGREGKSHRRGIVGGPFTIGRRQHREVFTFCGVRRRKADRPKNSREG